MATNKTKTNKQGIVEQSAEQINADAQTTKPDQSTPDPSIDPTALDQTLDSAPSGEAPPADDLAEKETETEKLPLPAAKPSKFEAECQAIAKRYAKDHPSSVAFHFCTDLKVFLSDDLNEARSHQASIGTGQILTIKIR